MDKFIDIGVKLIKKLIITANMIEVAAQETIQVYKRIKRKFR